MASLLRITCTGGSDAHAEFSVDGVVQCRGEAFIGRNGIGKKREGDGKTPLGTFRIRKAFGILPDPGTAFEYLQVGPGTVACDEQGPYYNTIVEGVECGGEKMSEMVPEYNLGMELDYNPDNCYPLGSAIFVHCKGVRPWTGGCIALDEGMVEHILKNADPDLTVEIVA